MVSQRLNIRCQNRYHGTFAKESNPGSLTVQNQLPNLLTDLSFFLVFHEDSIVFPPHPYLPPPPFSQDKGLGKQGGRRYQGKRKAFLLEQRLERRRSANSCWQVNPTINEPGCSSGQNLSSVRETLASLSRTSKPNLKRRCCPPAASAPPTYKEGALGGLVLLFSSFACIPLLGIYVRLTPLWPDRELSLLLFNRTRRHIAAKRVKTWERESGRVLVKISEINSEWIA